MSTWYEQAEARLKAESKAVTGHKETAMKSAVRDALLGFCCQNEEFAQAVVQGGSFADCMAAVARGVGGSISDLEVYRRAVSFYFPGAQVDMTLSIRMSRFEPSGRASQTGGILLDLADFL